MQGASVRRAGGEEHGDWTSARHYGTAREVRTIIDHIFVGGVWGGRIEKVVTQDGIEACSPGGHCHRAVVATVNRGGHPPLQDAEWRPAAGELCARGVSGEGDDATCMRAYQRELADQYRGQLRLEQARNEERGLGDDRGSWHRDTEPAAGRGVVCGCACSRLRGARRSDARGDATRQARPRVASRWRGAAPWAGCSR